MKKLMIVLSFSVFGNAMGQNEMVATVVSVIDGNTIEIRTNEPESVKVVLQGVDCPEPGQEYADKAKNFIEKLLLNKQVSVMMKGKDRWGNYVAIVMKGSVDPRIELLKEGLAWTAEKNPLPELEEVRLKAQEKGKGLWKADNPTPPWIYRREQSMMQAKSY